MNLSKREFMQVLGAGVMAGLPMGSYAQKAAGDAEGLYEMPRFGQVSFLHMTDSHAQLLPVHFREPSMNLGLGSMKGQLPHLVGAELLKVTGVKPDTPRRMP
jgi:S-sulfosulfanyl-L-cysteine sulfohydrolase